MKIAFFSDNFYPEISGISDSILILGDELIKRGHDVAYIGPQYSKKNYEKVVFTKSKNDLRLSKFTIFRVLSIKYPKSPTGQGRIVIPYGSTLKFIKNFSPDIIHTQTPFGIGIEALICSRLLKIPIVGTNHTPIEEYLTFGFSNINKIALLGKKFFSWYYNHCSYVTAPSNELIDNMKKSGLISKSSVVSNAIKLDLFKKISPEEKEKIKQDKKIIGPVILYAGRLAIEKHVDVVIKSIGHLVAKFPNIRLFIAGNGSQMEKLQNLVNFLNIKDNVIFTGFLDLIELAKLYNIADVFVIMGTAETQPMVLIQAFSSGVPAIGANAHGLIEYIRPERGFLVNYNDDIKLAEYIKKIIDDKEMNQKMGKAGIDFVSQFSPSHIADIWEEIYKKVINK